LGLGKLQIKRLDLSESTLAKETGWKIIRIPFWDWRALNGDEKAQEEYCRQALEGIG